MKQQEIEKIIDKALDDFTFEWQSHKEKKEGVAKYAKEILTQCQQDNAELQYSKKEVNKLLQDCAIHFGVTHIPKDDGTTLDKINEYIITTLNKQ